MKSIMPAPLILCLLGILLLPLSAMAQADCDQLSVEIEERIASGKYPDFNVQLAQQMLASFTQTCGMMDADTREAMFESFEGILPTKSEEERKTERRERAAKAKAAREARKLAKREAELNKPPVNPVILAPPTARSVAAQLIDRDDIMFHAWIWDWDIFNGNLRVLYSSYPDRTQYGLPDWKFHVYVAEMTPAGDITHRLITSKQANDHSALAFRRGHDEIIYQRHVNSHGEATSLERWSISGQRMLSSVDITGVELMVDGEAWRLAAFRMATSDGNLLYEEIKGGSYKKKRIRYAWFKLSPEGRMLGSGAASGIEDNVRPWSWFNINNGGGGLIVNIDPVDGTDLASGLRIPPDNANFGNALTAHVYREKRVLIVGADGKLELMSMPLERDIMPLGQPNAPQPTTMAEIQNQLQGQQQWMDSLVTRFDANRSTIHINVGPHRVEMVKETSRGYAYLTEVTANQNLNPPIHGPYIFEFDKQGEQNRIYLEPLALHLGIKLTMFAPSPNGGFYLHGTDQSTADSHVVLIDREGNPVARGHTTNAPNVRIEGIMADDSGVWLFGHAYQGKKRARLWIERIEFF